MTPELPHQLSLGGVQLGEGVRMYGFVQLLVKHAQLTSGRLRSATVRDLISATVRDLMSATVRDLMSATVRDLMSATEL